MASRAVSVARGGLKRAAELALELSGTAAVARRRMAGRDLVLAYHNIVDDREVRAGASGHLAASTFAAQMEVLARLADVVPVGELAGPAGERARPRVAITFDDGYASALHHGVPVLTSLGLPATFFVCPALMGAGPFWWDCEGLDVWGRRPELLERLQGRGALVWERLRAEGHTTRSPDDDLRPASLDVLLEAAARPGIGIGSHTMNHPNLASLTEGDVRRELTESRAWLSSRFPSFVDWVAYPFGLANGMVERVAREVGYAGAFVLDGGWIPPGASITALPRLNIAAGLSVRGFRLRLAGFFAR